MKGNKMARFTVSVEVWIHDNTRSVGIGSSQHPQMRLESIELNDAQVERIVNATAASIRRAADAARGQGDIEASLRQSINDPLPEPEPATSDVATGSRQVESGDKP